MTTTGSVESAALLAREGSSPSAPPQPKIHANPPPAAALSTFFTMALPPGIASSPGTSGGAGRVDFCRRGRSRRKINQAPGPPRTGCSQRWTHRAGAGLPLARPRCTLAALAGDLPMNKQRLWLLPILAVTGSACALDTSERATPEHTESSHQASTTVIHSSEVNVTVSVVVPSEWDTFKANIDSLTGPFQKIGAAVSSTITVINAAEAIAQLLGLLP